MGRGWTRRGGVFMGGVVVDVVVGDWAWCRGEDRDRMVGLLFGMIRGDVCGYVCECVCWGKRGEVEERGPRVNDCEWGRLGWAIWYDRSYVCDYLCVCVMCTRRVLMHM